MCFSMCERTLGFLRVFALIWSVSGLGAGSAFGVEVLSELPSQSCQEIQLNKPLKVYKDPALYPSSPGLIDVDPGTGLEMSHEENPLLSTFTGAFHFQRMGPPRAFREFGMLARIYGMDNDRVALKGDKGIKRLRRAKQDDLVLQIQVCGENDPYSGTLGLVFLKDLQQAQVEEQAGGLPPSVYPNPIPRLKDNPSVGASSGRRSRAKF